MNSILNKKDFIEIKYTGKANNVIFDSNIEEDLKQLDPKAKPQKTIIAVGEEMVLKGLDNAFEGKEIGKTYEITLSAKEGFGERQSSLIKTIPLKIFTEKKISPYPGLVLNLDGMIAKIITVSGARVITDFNNPLAGKEIHYKFTIIRKVEDEKEKVESLFENLFRFKPEYEIKKPATGNGLLDAQDAKHLDIKDKIIVKGPKPLEFFVSQFNEKFKNILGKSLEFQEKETKKDGLEDKIEEKKEAEENNPEKNTKNKPETNK